MVRSLLPEIQSGPVRDDGCHRCCPRRRCHDHDRRLSALSPVCHPLSAAALLSPFAVSPDSKPRVSHVQAQAQRRSQRQAAVGERGPETQSGAKGEGRVGAVPRAVQERDLTQNLKKNIRGNILVSQSVPKVLNSYAHHE